MQNGNLVIPKGGPLFNMSAYQPPKQGATSYGPSLPSSPVSNFTSQPSNNGLFTAQPSSTNQSSTAATTSNNNGLFSRILNPNTWTSGNLFQNLFPQAQAQTNPASTVTPTKSPVTTPSATAPGSPQAAAAQQQADLQKYFPGFSTTNNNTATPPPQTNTPPSQTSTQTSSNVPVVQGIFPSIVKSLANTQPYDSTQNAVTSLQNQTTNNPAQPNIGNLTNISNNQTPAVTNAQAEYNQFAKQSPLLLSEVQNNPNVAASVAAGRGQALGQILSGEQQALAQNVNNALAGQGQQITAGQEAGQLGLTGQQQQIGAAANAGNISNTAQGNQIYGQSVAQSATQPQLGAYGQTYYNPINTGQGGGGNLDPQNQASSLAQKVVSGQMSYQDAVNSMGYAGNAGQTFLNNAIQSINPSFNINQANVLATQQAQIVPAYNFAKTALTNLQGTMSQLGFNDIRNIPAGNGILNWLSQTTGINSQQTRSYVQAVQEARNAYAQLLASSKGGTPTDYGNQATAAIPDNATPNDIQAALNTIESLGGSKVSIYGQPGQSQYNSSQNSQFAGSAWE